MKTQLFWKKANSSGMTVRELIRLWNEKCPDDAVDESVFSDEELDITTGIEIHGEGDCEMLDRVLLDSLIARPVGKRKVAS